MTKLDQVERQLDLLLSQYDRRKDEASYKIQVAMLIAARRKLLKNLNNT